jgi:hypothetical protein
MSTKITPEALIEMGFVNDLPNEFFLKISKISICVIGKLVYIDDSMQALATNATTIEDIKDLIRLFK